MRGWLKGCASILYLGLLLVGGGVATAQDDGVHVDPNSPAGKEYALPLDSARREARGGATSGGGSGDSAPLFGVGISERGGSSSGEGTSGSASGGGQAEGPNDGGGAQNGASVGGVDSTQAARAVADTGGGLSAGVLALLIAFGVFAAGTLIGFSVRAIRGGHSSA